MINIAECQWCGALARYMSTDPLTGKLEPVEWKCGTYRGIGRRGLAEGKVIRSDRCREREAQQP